jgi:hypothetical protein
MLVSRGHVDEVDYFKQWALYDTGAVRRLGTTEDGTAIVAAVVAERQAWLADSITSEDAARWLAWDRRDLERVAAEQRDLLGETEPVQPGPRLGGIRAHRRRGSECMPHGLASACD